MARHGTHGRHRAPVLRRLFPAEAPATAATDQDYLVQDGDTFSSIAREHHIPTAKLLAMNGLSWSSGIAAGQRLSVPAGITAAAPTPAHTDITRHCIAEGETVTAIAAHYGVTRRAILSANGLHTSSLIFIGQILVIPAVSVDTQATAAVRVG
ncbi:MAG: LysM peptidoglycan-binding domain-containing protein [Microbacteriaceae bacterium]